ncbi:hypothetical protein D9611_011156 [Ephemerocybe angulata]|uniref:BZIP domain-containing protein n=1 Tax=Ephemerocybe angulata TaxID=980116 RepID=A0A8H5CE35_9AGAR|nr:hypothetical protein D9611_011156 [Tulosesus angulatus]
MSTASGHTASSVERPERSRNAKAQARHRAKRKAYIEQLEQTVTKLQAALGYSPEQVSALPPSSITIRELQQDNMRLQKEIEDLRRALADAGGGSRRGNLAPYPDPRGCDRDYKRRKMSSHLDGVYESPYPNERPPPLTIPQPLSHHYGNIPSHNGSQNAAPNSMFNLHGPAFQMPNTPSGSSATSSPPFSPIQMQANVSTTHYGSSVKVEDDSYSTSNQHSSSMHYSYSNQPHDMDWHYASERAHLHR